MWLANSLSKDASKRAVWQDLDQYNSITITVILLPMHLHYYRLTIATSTVSIVVASAITNPIAITASSYHNYQCCY